MCGDDDDDDVKSDVVVCRQTNHMFVVNIWCAIFTTRNKQKTKTKTQKISAVALHSWYTQDYARMCFLMTQTCAISPFSRALDFEHVTVP